MLLINLKTSTLETFLQEHLCVTRDDVFFQWNEYDSIKDLNVDEFKSLEDLENAGYSVLRLDNGKFVTDYL